MKTNIPLHYNIVNNALLAAAVAVGLVFGIQTTRATSASNFTIINHATGLPLSLYDYQGSIILLDFWAYWCGPCQAAAADIEPNVTQYYRNAGGNTNGVPVQVISVNIDMSSLASENSYIQSYGLELVGDDTSSVAWNQFGMGYIPHFAVINGTTNSSNYGAWEVLYSYYGYSKNTLMSYIDAVQTPAPVSTVVSPINGAVITSSNIPLGARITTKGKIIRKVEFYNGTTLIGSATNTPCSLTWSNVPAGAKSVFARACYGASSSADSVAVNFTVSAPVVAKLSTQGTNLLLSWTGGTGNFQVQVATNLAGAVWQNYGPAGTNTSLAIPRTNRAAFYRVSWP